MCGIAGVLAPSWSRDRCEAVVRRMCDAISHRGPDDQGLHWHAGVGIGMRRLSIVDLSGGHQPMSTEDESVWIVFNGEIYNAQDLRRRLIDRGHRFRTRSDTEVILHLYREEGLDFAAHMRGMWAVAIHDVGANRVVLSRDRFGIKPLYVFEDSERTVFASELRAFRAISSELGATGLELDTAAAQAMLSWSYVPGQSTIYRRVRGVEPATSEVRSTGKPTEVHRYWHLQADPRAKAVRSMGEAAELISAELRQSVQEHLESDVPVGAFLSGGIDSGLVAGYAADTLSGLSTFSIGFDVAAFDESPHAREIAKLIGSNHITKQLTSEDVYGALVDVLAACDGPFGDSSLIATWMVSRVAASTHKVVLSGDGGDEVFAGYVKHSIINWRRSLRAIPNAPLRTIDSLLRHLPQSREHRGTDFVRKVRRAVSGLGIQADRAYAALTRIAALDEAGTLLAHAPTQSPYLGLVERVFDAAPGGDELSKTLASDLAVVLPGDMLAKVDQASMLNSLEVRVPFLDHRVVEAGWGLAERFKLRGRTGKLVLRRLFADRYPRHLARRPKQGFQVPIESWLAGPLDPVLDWVFSRQRLERQGVLDPRAFVADSRREMLRRHPLLLWNAFCLAVWCEVTTGGLDDFRGLFADANRTPLARGHRSTASVRAPSS